MAGVDDICRPETEQDGASRSILRPTRILTGFHAGAWMDGWKEGRKNVMDVLTRGGRQTDRQKTGRQVDS